MKCTFTEDAAQKIRGFVNAGVPLRLAGEAAGVPWSTMKLWMSKGRQGVEPYEEFVQSLDQAKAIFAAAANLTIVRAANEGDWRAAAYMLEKRFPEHYRRDEKASAQRLAAGAGERAILEYPVAMPQGAYVPPLRTLPAEPHPLEAIETDGEDTP